MADPLDAFPTLFINGLPPNITELDIVNVMADNQIEAKVIIDKDPVTQAPRVKVVFRYIPDAERFFATVNGSAFLGSKVHLTFKDPNMNFSNTSGSKTIVVKRIPLQVTSLELYDAVRAFGRIIFCKVMMDRGGLESYALLQFEEQLAAEHCIAEMNGFVLRGSALTFNWQFPKNSNHIYPSMRSSSAMSNYSQMQQQQQRMPSGLEGGISLAVSAGWTEQPLTEEPTTPYGSYPSPNRAHWMMRTDPYSDRTNSSPLPTSPRTITILPTTGWHSRATVNASLIVNDPKQPAEHTWDESMTITLDDLKSISPAHAVLASSYESDLNNTPAASHRDSYSSNGSYSAAAAPLLDPRNLYVKNLPIDPIFDTQDLYALFSEYGTIVSAKVMMDEVNWVSKGFGFVSFRDEEEARVAMEALNGFVLDPVGVPKGLVVCVAEPKGFRERKLMVLHGTGR